MRKKFKIGNNTYAFSIYDIALGLSFLWLLVLVSPYVVAQFTGLEKLGDIIWNFCLDLVIFNAAIVVFCIVGSLLNMFDRWVDRKKISKIDEW